MKTTAQKKDATTKRQSYILETRFDKQTKLWSKSPKTQRSFGQKLGINGKEREKGEEKTTTELNPMDKESKMVLLTLYSFIHDSWRLRIYSLIFHLLKYSWSSPSSAFLLLLLYVCVSLFSSCHKKVFDDLFSVWMEYRVLVSFSIVVSIVCCRFVHFFSSSQTSFIWTLKIDSVVDIVLLLISSYFFLTLTLRVCVSIWKFSWSLRLFLLKFIRRGLLHWSVVSVGACVNTLAAHCLCRDDDDIVVSECARYLFTISCVKISRRKHCRSCVCL